MFRKNFNQLGILIFKNKGVIAIALVSLFLLVPSIFASGTPEKTSEKVLGVTKDIPSPTLLPSPSILPSPKPLAVVSLSPTLSPTPNLSPTQSPTPSSSSNTTSSASSTPAVTSTPTPSPSPTSSPTPVGLTVRIGLDYAGQKSNDSYTVSIQPGKKAWDGVVEAVGINNIVYEQYSFGTFITGFNGISADPSSQYYEFRVNGASSSVGVSDYVLSDNDQLDFVLTSF